MKLVRTLGEFVAGYKAKYNADPNIGAVYGYVAADRMLREFAAMEKEVG
jgi:hypothetical protein